MSWRPSPPPGGDEPRRLRDSLDRYAKRVGAPQASALGAVFSRWGDIVGEGVVAHARPISLVGGALVVAVEEPGWATQLRFLEAEILARLEQVAGAGVADRVEVRVERPRRRS